MSIESTMAISSNVLKTSDIGVGKKRLTSTSAGATNIDFRLQPSPHAPLGGPFDVILLSEVVYYWDDADLADFAGAFERVLAPRGRFILVHWLGETDYPKTADEAVNAFRAALEGAYSAERVERTADYRLDVWRGR